MYVTDMKIINTTKHPSPFLRRVVSWCMKELNIQPHVLVSATFRNKRRAWSGTAWTGRITVRIGETKYPTHSRYSRMKGAVRFDMHDEVEVIVCVIAHELAHVRFYHTHRGPKDERSIDAFAYHVLKAFRGKRDELLMRWNHTNQPQENEMPIMLSQLEPGTAFRLTDQDLNITGRLLKVNECRAVVRLDKPDQVTEIQDSTGAIKTIKAKAGTAVTSWAPSVLVDPIADSVAADAPPPTVDDQHEAAAAEAATSDAGGARNVVRKMKADGKMSMLDAAVEILKRTGKPMHVKEMIPAMAEAGLWESAKGKTPWATLWAAMPRDERFVKTAPGVFGLK